MKPKGDSMNCQKMPLWPRGHLIDVNIGWWISSGDDSARAVSGDIPKMMDWSLIWSFMVSHQCRGEFLWSLQGKCCHSRRMTSNPGSCEFHSKLKLMERPKEVRSPMSAPLEASLVREITPQLVLLITATRRDPCHCKSQGNRLEIKRMVNAWGNTVKKRKQSWWTFHGSS